MYPLQTFDTDALVSCRKNLHESTAGASSMEVVAQRIAEHLHQNLTLPDGERACALVRFYKTHRFGLLPDDLQAYVRLRTGQSDIGSGAPCLTLLGTAGTEEAWNDRRRSEGHRAILLQENLDEAPMIAALIHELDIDPGTIVNPPNEVRVDVHLRQYNVFYVPEAAGSAAVPAQHDFVIPHGIRSVIGFGGVLASGDMFAVILFSTTFVPEEPLANLRSLALTVKTAIVPHTYAVFEP